jgi:hypothetical protein
MIPNTHYNLDQQIMHGFYFNKFSNGTYKGGTFCGFDITFGGDNAYFGILLRSIQNMTNHKITEGPCNVVRCILKEYNCDSIMNFTNGANLNITDNDQNFFLVYSPNILQKQIYAGPRIGLSNKYPEYVNRAYRFATDKDKLKKKKTLLVLALE